MKQKFYLAAICIAACFVTAPAVNAQTIVTFEGLLSSPNTSFNGDTGIGSNNNGWTAGGVFFENEFTAPSGGFDAFYFGWSYSNIVDVFTPGVENQFASFPGGGSNGAASPSTVAGETYVIGAVGSGPTDSSFLNFSSLVTLNSVDLANTTYAGRYIADGVAPPFGGVAFQDGDFYRVTINGFDGNNGTGNSTGSTTLDLANYGAVGSGPGDDQLLADWTQVDLSGFGQTQSLTFSATSSQISTFPGFGSFSDVPAFIALDNLAFTAAAVPEPSSLLGLAAMSVVFVVRRRRK